MEIRYDLETEDPCENIIINFAKSYVQLFAWAGFDFAVELPNFDTRKCVFHVMQHIHITFTRFLYSVLKYIFTYA